MIRAQSDKVLKLANEDANVLCVEQSNSRDITKHAKQTKNLLCICDWVDFFYYCFSIHGLVILVDVTF